MKYFFVDDSVKVIGGTSLTLDAIIEPNAENVELIPTSELKFIDCVEKSGTWIFGNITALNHSVVTNILWLLENKTCVKVEFDYGYCAYRSPNSHLSFKNEECSCFSGECEVPPLQNIYRAITEKCKHIFYMSQQQLNLHIKNTQLGSASRSVLTSCFTSKTYESFSELANQEKNNKYAILKGQGGWHSKAKGFEKSKEYVRQNNLQSDIIQTETHDKMLKLLSTYKGLIFLPIIQDTCPRIVIEAKLLGLELIINNNCQHITEDWWKDKSIEEITTYLKSRPEYFWRKMENISQGI